MHFAVLFDFQPGSAHIGEAFHSFCEVFDGFICVSMFDTVTDAMLDMPFQDYLSAAMKCRFCGVQLGKNILTRDIFIDHSGNGLRL